MKLLLDQNISPRLVGKLSDIYPGSLHVQDINLDRAQDSELWDFAGKGDFVIVTKDADFSERSLVLGFPPKIVWIRRGNCSTKEIETILRDNHKDIANLAKDDKIGVLILM